MVIIQLRHRNIYSFIYITRTSWRKSERSLKVNNIFSLTNEQQSIVRDVSWHPTKPFLISSSVSTMTSELYWKPPSERWVFNKSDLLRACAAHTYKMASNFRVMFSCQTIDYTLHFCFLVGLHGKMLAVQKSQRWNGQVRERNSGRWTQPTNKEIQPQIFFSYIIYDINDRRFAHVRKPSVAILVWEISLAHVHGRVWTDFELCISTFVRICFGPMRMLRSLELCPMQREGGSSKVLQFHWSHSTLVYSYQKLSLIIQ